MVPRRAGALSLALLLLALPLAGCIGPKDTPLDDAGEDDVEDDAPTTNATLPDGRGESLGNKETNKTEEGVGGMDHKHDYWKGADQVVVFDQRVRFQERPLYPDGEGTDPKSVAYVKLPQPNLVYEGAEKVSVVASQPELYGAPHPSPPRVHLQYRSAADAEWRDPVPLDFDTPLDIAVKPIETDMPHSVSSLWVFRLTTDQPNPASIHLLITAYKGSEVVDWPGHPDFYADSHVRKVADNKPVKTHMSGMAEAYLYDAGSTWAAPDKLISYGTSKLHVIMNVTSATSQYGASATGFFLEVHNATIIGPEVRFGDRYSEMNDNNDLKTYEFEVPVDAAGMDGPYQPASRWGFRLMATFADADTPVIGVGLCPGCFSYDIEYEMTIFAIHEEGAAEIQG